MRSQTKPFTIETRKSRRLPNQGETELGVVGVKGAILEPTRLSPDAPDVTGPDRVFRTIARSGRTAPF